mgnify:CR=1 FL=1
MPSMDAEIHLASDLTNAERIEHLLTVVACALTGQPAHQVCPWRRAGIDDFMRRLGNG